MHLRRLELVGFKTFADRTSLEFSPRITAIVGPNGSGKSNIFDAVRWALGEGSLRSLRGTRNEDVIFAGTDRRRQLGMAEVTLTLDNSDGTLTLPSDGGGDAPPTPLAFTEVTVTRRALRGSDSQYLINSLPCRLRDIQTTFLGTGLGGHSYALITQGEVEHTLDATPEERRMILEEAAGVAKYKRRRRDAERRMAAADQLLLRVTDILGEQEAHVTQLAAQAESARRYQAYTQELRAKELALQVEEVRRLARAQRRVRDQLEHIAARRREVEGALRTLESERAALDRRASEAGRDWDEAQRALVRLTERRTAEEAGLRLFDERRRGLQAQRERIAREAERYRQEEAALAQERVALDDAERSLADERDRTVAVAAAAEARLGAVEQEAAQAEHRLDAGRAEARAVAEACSRARSAVAAAEARAAGHRDRVASLAERRTFLDAQRAGVEERRREIAASLEQATADLAGARERLGTLRREYVRVSAAREQLRADLHQAEVERETVRSRLRYLEDAHARYSGYDTGARELLLARQRDPEAFAAIKGTVVEALSVPRELRVAIEAALGPALSALLVESFDDARALRAAWGPGDLGAVTFFPVSLAQPGAPAPPIPMVAAVPGVRGRALDLVHVFGTYPDVVQGLLADVLVVEDLDAAAAARAAGHPGPIVTIAGDRLSREGMLAMGHGGAERGTVVGRSEEIAETRAALVRLEAAAREQGGMVELAATRVHEIEAGIADADAAIAAVAERRTEAERRLTLLDAEIARIDEEGAALTAEQEVVRREVATQEALRDGLRIQAETLDARFTALEAEAAALGAHLRDQVEAARAARDEITQLRIALTEIAGRGASLRIRADEIARAAAQAVSHGDVLARETAQLDEDIARLDTEEAAARARCDALAQDVSDLEETMRRLDAERTAVADRRAALDEEQREAAGRGDLLAEEAHRVELRQAQVDAEMGSARRRIEEEFGQPFERAAGTVAEALDRDETLGRIESLRGLIAALGPVNLIAIEEHRQAAARAEALRVQLEDVQGALAALRATIADLEAVIREQFDATFRAVNDEFAALFVRLFGGGRASLELVEVEGSDEPGVDITVQPSGKALRSLSALSGGERVMVALALIFAMLRVRPSPFCVFDEVEAALDEANTRKIAQVLCEISEQSQIIIITHNKATMEVCDIMFGVTMEEPGISHMVSMRLQDRERVEAGRSVG
ncbi:MAG TPA: chromosome segregation protein SMC [bacterium]|nr:chromosome segregation protein SMC [bacterium]